MQTKAAAWLANIIVANLGFASATALASAMIPIMISVLQQIAVAPMLHP